MVKIGRMLLALVVAPWAGVVFVHLFDPTAFRHDLRTFFSVSLMLAEYGYLAEAVFALPILLIWKQTRNPSAFVAVLWSSLAASATLLLVLTVATGGHLASASDLWMTITPKYMWPYWVAGSLSGLTYLLIVRRSRP
jgi:hypothetical protein